MAQHTVRSALTPARTGTSTRALRLTAAVCSCIQLGKPLKKPATPANLGIIAGNTTFVAQHREHQLHVVLLNCFIAVISQQCHQNRPVCAETHRKQKE